MAVTGAIWQYSAWREQATDTARLSMLRQHMTEVADVLRPTHSAGGQSFDARVIRDYLAQLEEHERRLEKATGSGAARMSVLRADLHG